MMSSISLLAVVVAGCVWWVTAIQSWLLIWRFRRRYPDESKAVLPPPGLASPAYLRVLYMPNQHELDLFHGAPELWRMRARLIRLSWLSLVLPMVSMAIFLLVALLDLNGCVLIDE